MNGQHASPVEERQPPSGRIPADGNFVNTAGNEAFPPPPLMSGAETREIVTPYAFKVADELLGQPLASPWRRLFAQVIDLAAIAVLSTANAFILAFLVALTFFKAGNNLAHRPRRSRTRRLLRFSGATLLFSVIYLAVTAYNDIERYDTEHADTGGLVTPFLGGINVAAWSLCEDDDCKREVASEFGEAMGENRASAGQVQNVFEILVSRSDEQSNDEAILREFYLGTYNKMIEQQKTDASPATNSDVSTSPSTVTLPDSASSSGQSDIITFNETSPPASRFSLIEIVKGLIADLGLGFGWAALYYSVFTAWWRGSTPGKRLMGIRVLKLDGSTLTLWESFGRYGGYGAGLATGLLGFVQVFWDPNRQSIQDKIAETLVLRKSEELKRITASSQSLSGTHGEGI
ncbi:RDD family protein [Alteromonas sp. H39]|uniref:RDD family protein n=1 Tax=Alteromonas sp. H39 TaxID=3389876 RepID=UPI0039E00522